MSQNATKNTAKIETIRLRRYDSRNFVIEQLVPGGKHPVTGQTGPDKWEIAGYYGKLEDAAAKLLDMKVDLPESLSDLLPAIREAQAQLAASLKEIVQ